MSDVPTFDGLMDSASIAGVVAAFYSDSFMGTSQWNVQSAAEVTSTLINANSFGVASGYRPGDQSDGYQTTVLREFHRRNMLASTESPQSILIGAKRETESWISSDHADLLNIYCLTMEDPSCDYWLFGAITQFWKQHSKIHHGLFNEEHIPYLARLLHCPEKTIERIHVLSEVDVVLDKWIREWKKRSSGSSDLSGLSEDLRLAATCYMISALIRARFHYHVSKNARRPILHHPFRQYAVPRIGIPQEVRANNTERYFSAIILYSAMLEPTGKRKISHWAKNVGLAREAVGSKLIVLRETATQDEAWEAACKAAKSAKLEFYPAGSDLIVDLGLGLLVDNLALTFFGVPPGAGFAATVGINRGIQQVFKTSLGTVAVSKGSRVPVNARLVELSYPHTVFGKFGK